MWTGSPFYTIFILEIRSILGIQKQGSACSNSSSQTVCSYTILAALEKRTAMFISFSFLCQTNSTYSNHRQQLLPSTSPVSLCKQPFPMWASAATFLFFLSTLFKTPSLIFLHWCPLSQNSPFSVQTFFWKTFLCLCAPICLFMDFSVYLTYSCKGLLNCLKLSNIW